MTEKIEAFWVDATAGDVALVMAGETVEARFRDFRTDDWHEDSLAGWKLLVSGPRWIDSDGTIWKQCQVYSEPSWHANKPDPGPGCRLLGKFPEEELKPGDECFTSTGVWDPSYSATIGERQSYGMWYRRRIEAVGPEPRRYVLRVGDTIETPDGHLIEVVSPGVEQIEFKLKAGYTATLPNGQTITATEKGFEVTQ
jgi:hypothetical protein